MAYKNLLTQVNNSLKKPLAWVTLVYNVIYVIATFFVEKMFANAVGFGEKSYIIGFLSTFLIFWFCVYAVRMAEVVMYYYEHRKFEWFKVAMLLCFLILTLIKIVTVPLLYIPSMLLFFIMLKIVFPSEKVKTVS